MKNIIFILISFSIITAFTSCSDADILDPVAIEAKLDKLGVDSLRGDKALNNSTRSSIEDNSSEFEGSSSKELSNDGKAASSEGDSYSSGIEVSSSEIGTASSDVEISSRIEDSSSSAIIDPCTQYPVFEVDTTIPNFGDNYTFGGKAWIFIGDSPSSEEPLEGLLWVLKVC